MTSGTVESIPALPARDEPLTDTQLALTALVKGE